MEGKLAACFNISCKDFQQWDTFTDLKMFTNFQFIKLLAGNLGGKTYIFYPCVPVKVSCNITENVPFIFMYGIKFSNLGLSATCRQYYHMFTNGWSSNINICHSRWKYRKSCNISSMSKSMMLINIMIVFIESMKNDSFLVIRYHVVLLRSKLSWLSKTLWTYLH